ncbi:unnamed protein product [Oikopleura dioica]|uniref:Uncharacterized protein n=1 Tax=Oikopleura dioica TaxID=34765 RepID=E4XZA3_OIKDI|nr:unnamed protein product [Oikopleura dioica]
MVPGSAMGIFARPAKDKLKKVSVLTYKSSPTLRPDKCFYYAPEYNLNRFEVAQGFIASNHFNAKLSTISFQRSFHVMSLNIEESWISKGTSTTGSLNAIRKFEESTKGWKKGEIALPHEFQDLDPVHIQPFVDLGRFLVVLVARSIELSNTQYSLLLENDGELLNLGSEWIGARIQYKKRPNCFSEMLASEDFEYTDYWGYNNDECEYFINAFVSMDRIYLQSYIFDTTFELEMVFDNIELQYNQLDENNKLHVTSNPRFAFHDDVFPNYVKNRFTQKTFSRHANNKITIIPDSYFTSLAFFEHISSVLLDSGGAYIISFAVKNPNELLSSEKILELKFSGGENLLSVELSSDSSIKYDSVFIENKIIEHKDMSYAEINFFIKLNLETSKITINDADKKWRNEKDYKFNITRTDKKNKEAIKIYKYDRKTAIKNFVIYSEEKSEDYMLLMIEKDNVNKGEIFLISGDFSYFEKSTLVFPQFLNYFGALHAVFKGRNYFFGSKQLTPTVCVNAHCFI